MKLDTDSEARHHLAYDMTMMKERGATRRILFRRPGRRQLVARFFCGLVINVLLARVALASDLLIIYPEAPSPYSKVFEDMIKGVSSQYTGTIHRLQTSSYSDSAYVRARLKRSRPDIILALGSNNVAMLTAMNVTIPIIAGALRARPEGTPGISIFPDPVAVMDKLLLLSPDTDSVFVVTALTAEDGHLEAAQSHMATLGKRLVIHRVADIQTAASQYLEVARAARAYDAIWILPGEPAIDNAIMGQLLQTAWDRNIVLFSSNPNDVRRGTLFAVYPDNENMGRDLGILVNQQLAGDIVEPGFSPVKQLHLAVNLRTSRHLGLQLSGTIRNHIHLEL